MWDQEKQKNDEKTILTKLFRSTLKKTLKIWKQLTAATIIGLLRASLKHKNAVQFSDQFDPSRMNSYLELGARQNGVLIDG